MVYDRYNYHSVEIADLGARKEHILSVTSPMVDEPMEKQQITIQQTMVLGSTTVVELCERRYQINA